jgi:multidrug resistance efflux pump
MPVNSASASREDLQQDPTLPRPELVPDLERHSPQLSQAGVALLILAGAALGFGVVQAVRGRTQPSAASGPSEVATVAVEKKRFEDTLRVGGTVGATNFAMIRAPRMRGGRDRGGGGGGGGSSLTIESIAEPGSIVRKGDIVAVFESKRTEDFLDNYRSNLAQARARAASRRADLLISAETLRQNYRRAESEADKADLDLRTAGVKSQIQAQILALQARQQRVSAQQLKEEVRLSEIADTAATRSLEIDVEQSERRLERTMADLEKMRLRTPVSGLVVVESMFKRDSISQAAAGDQLNPGSYFLRIVDLSNMAVFAAINQADAQLVEIGDPVGVELDAYPGVSFEGRVAAIGPMAVSTGSTGGGRGSRGSSRGTNSRWVRQVPVQIEILDADDRIKPDLSASADIVLRTQEDALVIPRAATAKSSGRDVVWVQQGRKFVERPVQVGLLSDTQATIGDGLREGEVIAAQPVSDLDELVEQGDEPRAGS